MTCIGGALQGLVFIQGKLLMLSLGRFTTDAHMNTVAQGCEIIVKEL